jgi:hypothetical protein
MYEIRADRNSADTAGDRSTRGIQRRSIILVPKKPSLLRKGFCAVRSESLSNRETSCEQENSKLYESVSREKAAQAIVEFME